MAPGSALKKASPSLPDRPVQTMDSLRSAYKQLASDANLVAPVASVDYIMELHGISFRTVMIDAKVDNYGNGSEVYRDGRFCQPNERALGGKALEKIAAASGVQILQRRRLDDRSEPYYCEVEITVGLRDYDGTWRQATKTKELDLRDGRPETTKPEKIKKGGRWEKTGKTVALDPSALADKRRHIQSLTETKAFYRALRTILTLKQKYTVEELANPFVVPKLVPMLDANDPDQKRALLEMATGRDASLYGHDGGPMRETKDVTPQGRAASLPDAESGASSAPGGPRAALADDDGAAFEPLDFPEPDEEDPIIVCTCPCGDQVEISEELAKTVVEHCGTTRCRDCFPGKSFNVEQHSDLAGVDLELPKFPGLTVERIAERLKAGSK